MRLALLSDIHGNLHALEAVLADAGALGAEAYLCLGDLAFHGPEPAACVERVQSLGCPVVRGNCDRWVAHHWQAPPDAVLAKLWEQNPRPSQLSQIMEQSAWVQGRLSPDQVAYLGSLPGEFRYDAGGLGLLAVHASPGEDLRGIAPDLPADKLDSLVQGAAGSAALLFGHTHQQWLRCYQGLYLINPGSIGSPYDGDLRAAYALLELRDGALGVQLRRVPYDTEAACARAREVGMPGLESWLEAHTA